MFAVARVEESMEGMNNVEEVEVEKVAMPEITRLRRHGCRTNKA
jgi:hypothetical protein